MSDDNNKKSFKIFGDDNASENPEEAEILLDDEMVISRGAPSKKQKIPKEKTTGGYRGPRPFLMVFLVFCILGGAIYVVYDHLNARLNHVEASGAHEVADLSKELDQRMGVFSAQFANQHAEMNLQIENLQKLLKESVASIKSMNTEINANKKAISDGMSGLESRFNKVDGQFDTFETAITGKINSLESKTSAFESRLNKLAETDQNIAEINREFKVVQTNLDTMGARIGEISERLDSLASEKDAQDFTRHMEEMRQEFDQRFESMQNRMNSQTVSLEDEISALEAIMQSFKELTLQNNQREIIEQDLR